MDTQSMDQHLSRRRGCPLHRHRRNSMSFRKTLTALAIAGALATGSARADTILTFGQGIDGSPIVGLNNGAGVTTITASAVPVTITQILAGIAEPIDAFLQLDATSIA